MFLSVLAAALAVEPCRTTWAGLAPTLDGLDASWGISAETFRAGMKVLDIGVPCLAEVLTPSQAARIHRAEGLEAWLDRDTERARAAFAAARAADPTYTFPVEMIPNGNPVRTLYDTAFSSGASSALPPPAAGRLVMDGRPTRDRVLDRATLFQLEQGGVTTTWLAPADPTPAYTRRGQGARLPLLLAGAAAAAGGVAMYYVADGMKNEPPAFASEADLQAFTGRNHALVLGAGGLGAAATACVTTAFVWGRW